MPTRKTNLRLAIAVVGSLAVGTFGCSSLADVDVKCEKLCLTAPGPTIPGLAALLPAGWDAGFLVDGSLPPIPGLDIPVKSDAGASADGGGDGGLFTAIDAEAGIADFGFAIPDGGLAALLPDAGWPSSVIEQVIPMDYNALLKQVPGIAVGMDADVRLTSLKVIGPIDLGFIDEIAVTIFPGNGGKIGTTASLDPALAAAPVDAGLGDTDGGAGSSCGAAGLLVGSYRRLVSGLGGTTAELQIVNPAVNLFSCLKSAPANFDIQIRIAPGELPSADTPLSVTSCMSAHANVELP
jgi:hypothetical protein